MKTKNQKSSYDANMHYGASGHTFKKARELRNNLTEPETVLWHQLRGKKLGFKFRRQHAIGIYIADFYCHELKLVIEVDGKVHEKELQKKWDENRNWNMHLNEVKLIRFTNDQVMNHLDYVLKSIAETAREILSDNLS